MTNPTKPTNPKDKLGIKRVPSSVRSAVVDQEVGVALLEGARKYRRHNYRVASVLASVYFDATKRHLDYWWEGENLDPDTGLSHITKAIASLYVLRDAMIQDKFNDDRPPKTVNLEGHKQYLQSRIDEIFEKIPDGLEPYTELNKDDEADYPHGQALKVYSQDSSSRLKLLCGRCGAHAGDKHSPECEAGV